MQDIDEISRYIRENRSDLILGPPTPESTIASIESSLSCHLPAWLKNVYREFSSVTSKTGIVLLFDTDHLNQDGVLGMNYFWRDPTVFQDVPSNEGIMLGMIGNDYLIKCHDANQGYKIWDPTLEGLRDLDFYVSLCPPKFSNPILNLWDSYVHLAESLRWLESISEGQI